MPTVPVISSVPPLALIVPPPFAIFAATVPAPVNFAPAPTVKPDASVSVPPAMEIVPLVMLSATPMVSAPLPPTSSVWLALLIAIADDAVAVLENSRVEAVAVAMVNALLLVTAPVKSSTPPLAVIVALDWLATALVTTPKPLSSAGASFVGELRRYPPGSYRPRG